MGLIHTELEGMRTEAVKVSSARRGSALGRARHFPAPSE